MGGRFAHALLVGLNRRPSLKIKLGCLVVLIFAQALVGGLSVLALYRLNAETTADRVEVDVRRIAHAIEGGLRLGKPLEQFHGMGLLVDRGLASASGGLGILVTMASGEQVAARGEMISDAAIFVRAMAAPDAALARGQVRRPDGTIVALDRERVVVAVPLIDSASNTRGLVMLAVAPDVTKVQQFAARNLKVLLWVTLAVGVGLTVVFKCLGPNSWLICKSERGSCCL